MSDLKHLTTFTAGVILPGAQAAITGGAAGVVVGSIAYISGGDPVAWGALSGGLVFCGAWLGGLSWWRSAISPQPAPDAYIPASESVRVELVRDEGRWVDWLHLPMSLDTVSGAAVHLVDNNYNTSNLGGAGRVLTRAEAESLRDWLILHELGSWRRPGAHTAGWDLTPAGRALMRRLASMVEDVPTTPEQVLPQGWAYRSEVQTHTDPQNP